eukprot:scaffold8881_cov199-Skeletonema_marinoi.AAC.12
MSTPVVTSKWAGTFACGGTCRRKQLMGEEFSKKALERHRKDGKPLKCKQCVAADEQTERENAAKRKGDDDNSDETRKCVGKCSQVLPKASFNRNQYSKGEGKSRCRDCVEQSVKDESANQQKSKEEKITAARKKVEDAKRSGKAHLILAAESELAALEAEKGEVVDEAVVGVEGAGEVLEGGDYCCLTMICQTILLEGGRWTLLKRRLFIASLHIILNCSNPFQMKHVRSRKYKMFFSCFFVQVKENNLKFTVG